MLYLRCVPRFLHLVAARAGQLPKRHRKLLRDHPGAIPFAVLRAWFGGRPEGADVEFGGGGESGAIPVCGQLGAAEELGAVKELDADARRPLVEQPTVRPTNRPEVAEGSEALLRGCAAIVALHPDEATDAVVDWAVRHRRPFAVVPCCVFSRLFPHRRIPFSVPGDGSVGCDGGYAGNAGNAGNEGDGSWEVGGGVVDSWTQETGDGVSDRMGGGVGGVVGDTSRGEKGTSEDSLNDGLGDGEDDDGEGDNGGNGGGEGDMGDGRGDGRSTSTKGKCIKCPVDSPTTGTTGRLTTGRPVTSRKDLIEYLVLKDPCSIKTSMLDFDGANIVVWADYQ